MRSWFVAAVVLATLCGGLAADTLEFVDGRVLENCYVRDDGVQYLVWPTFRDVGGPWKEIPRSQIKSWKMERDEQWDSHPNLPDLSVSFIELTPHLSSFHGIVQYDQYGRPVLGGAKSLVDVGDRAPMAPEEIAANLKLKYEPGEQVTLTAHVKNNGFVPADTFVASWLIDGKEIYRERHAKQLGELEEATFKVNWSWQEGFHEVTLRLLTDQPEIATFNNQVTDPLWGWGFAFVVNKGRIKAWHEVRTACGTFSFEDYYRWHVDLMNTLFAASIFPSSPEGIKARVRLDRIIYCDDIAVGQKTLVDENGVSNCQGAWTWGGEEEDKKQWNPPDPTGRNSTEWSLPHELGHQLGLTDWYALDDAGYDYFTWPDNGEKIAHFQTHPVQMMHWHGPHLYGEVDAGYFNMTYDKPRGHFGDFYFAIPQENYLRIVDVNGIGVPAAKVEIFQRACDVDPNGQPGTDHGVTYYPVVEDGDFYTPRMSKQPVIVGTTDQDGLVRLPNRPVMEVRTFNGFHRTPNPFGNINVVGNRGLMLVRVTKDDRPAYFHLEIYDFNVAWFRGQKDSFTITLKTPYRSESSPLPPKNVTAERVEGDQDHVRVTWEAPDIIHEQQYLDKVIGYRVYRRIGPMTLADRPWFCVATLGPNEREFVVDLKQRPEDVYWFALTERYAVSSLGELSMESELVETLLAGQQPATW
jgi:hypothetical protein